MARFDIYHDVTTINGSDVRPADLRAVKNICSYQPEGYQFTQAFKLGRWDGFTTLMRKNSFPTGLSHQVISYFESIGTKLTFFDHRKKPPLAPIPFSNFNLRDYQVAAVAAAIKATRGNIVIGTGGGKMRVAAAIMASLGLPAVLLVNNVEALHDTYTELCELLPSVSIGRFGDGHSDKGHITVATIQSAYAKNSPLRAITENAGCVILDECFAPGTLVSTPTGCVDIESLKVGDSVYSFNETMRTVETKRVTHVFANHTTSPLVRSKFSTGAVVTGTPEHPFYTQRGYIPFRNLQKRLDMMLTITPRTFDETAKRTVLTVLNFTRSAVKTAARAFPPLWQGVLFPRMQTCISPQNSLRDYGIHQSYACVGAYEGQEPDAKSSVESQSCAVSQTFWRALFCNAWWKWLRAACPSKTSVFGARLAYRGSYPNEDGRARLPKFLQGGYWQQLAKDLYRSRWRVTQSSVEAARRRQEDFSPRKAWLESSSVLKSGSAERHAALRGSGTVYNLEVEGNNNYFVEGILVHNCHHGAAKKWYEVASKSLAFYKFGMTGTLSRQDEKDIYLQAFSGRKICDYPVKWLIDHDYLCPVSITFHTTRYSGDMDEFTRMSSQDRYAMGIVANQARNLKIAEIARNRGERSAVILVNRVEHGQALSELLGAPFVSGKTKKSERRTIKADILAGKLTCVIATSLYDESVNNPIWKLCINAAGFSPENAQIQRLGRILRKVGNATAEFHDFFDTFDPWLKTHSKHRLKYLTDEGHTVSVV